MTKGRIVLVPFPFTDLSGQKVRPALVLHASGGEDCIVAFISSLRPAKKHRFAISIEPSSYNGLKVRSSLKIDKLATLQKKIVVGELGSLENHYMKATGSALRKLFAL